MTDRLGQQFGNYRLVRLLGQGGFADVYLAEHIHLRTQAAIKILSMRLTGDNVENFRNEARTVARLIHPHIVRVLDFGVQENTPYLVMDYAPNGTLRQRHPKGSSLPLSSIMSYVKQVTEALHYAHERKLIHRDIKPENMLLSENQQVLLSDFGIALVTQSTHYQSTQEVVGTAAYMAPEQLQGKPRRASDQYALGVVVYEWICGDRPFHGSFTEIYSQHMFVPPPPLREKVPGLPPAIEEVVFTALAKDPQRRFGSVQAFATALEQACRSAQDTSFPQRDQLLQPTVASLPPSQHIWPAGAAFSSGQAAQRGVMLPTQPGQPQSSQSLISRRAVLLGVAGLVVASGGITWLALTHSSSGPVAKTISTVTPVHTGAPTRTSPPLGTTLYTYRGHSSGVFTVAWSPDGNRIASGSYDFTAQVWDAATGGNVLTYRRHTNTVEAVAWSPDGRRIASGSGDSTVQIWDAATGGNILTYRGHSNAVHAVAWSPDGRRIASGSFDHTVQIWDAATGGNILTYRGHSDIVYTVAWSPDGRRVASGGKDGTAQVWDAATGGNVFTYRGHSSSVDTVAWSPDGRRIASGSGDSTVQVWDAALGGNVFIYRGHTIEVHSVVWSPDGRRIASGSFDSTVQVWDAATGGNVFTYPGHSKPVFTVAWSPDGRRIASGGLDLTVQVWQAG